MPSHQRMQEVFGQDAEKQESILAKKFGVSFFNAENEHEYKTALLEAEQIKQLGMYMYTTCT